MLNNTKENHYFRAHSNTQTSKFNDRAMSSSRPKVFFCTPIQCFLALSFLLFYFLSVSYQDFVWTQPATPRLNDSTNANSAGYRSRSDSFRSGISDMSSSGNAGRDLSFRQTSHGYSTPRSAALSPISPQVAIFQPMISLDAELTCMNRTPQAFSRSAESSSLCLDAGRRSWASAVGRCGPRFTSTLSAMPASSPACAPPTCTAPLGATCSRRARPPRSRLRAASSLPAPPSSPRPPAAPRRPAPTGTAGASRPRTYPAGRKGGCGGRSARGSTCWRGRRGTSCRGASSRRTSTPPDTLRRRRDGPPRRLTHLGGVDLYAA